MLMQINRFHWFYFNFHSSIELLTLHSFTIIAQMPKNKGKGGKNRRRGKNEGDDDKRELEFKVDGQGVSHCVCFNQLFDAITLQSMRKSQRCWGTAILRRTASTRCGGSAISAASCARRYGPSKSRLPILNTVVCQVWIGTGDIVLVGLRDYEKDKADVILKYTADEARDLKSYGELPENGLPLLSFCRAGLICLAAKINETTTYGQGEGDDDIVFDDVSDDDIDGVR